MGQRKTKHSDEDHLYSTLIEQAPDPIITLDRLGTIRFVNSAAERVSALKAEELIGKHFTQTGVLSAEGAAKSVQEFVLVLSGEIRAPFELAIIRKSGERFLMEANPKLLSRTDGSALVQVIFRDITQRKEMEDLLRRRAAEIEQVNQIMMNREKRIFEMKQEVNQLLAEMGRPPRYET